MSDSSNSKSVRKVNPLTIWGVIIIIVLGMVVGFNYVVFKLRAEQEMKMADTAPPPKIGRLEDDLDAIESSGRNVKLSELRGKILVIGYVFTRCPRGCAGVVAQMKVLQEKFGKDPRFHLVSVSLDGDYDTPETLTKFAEANQITGDNWWFITGDKDKIRAYMSNPHQIGFMPVQFVPEKDRINDADLYIHDMRLAIVDHLGQVRGRHEVLHPQLSDVVFEKLVSDLEKVFKEADALEEKRKK
jgi:protein SCO1